jgi:hypothetical protein
MCFLKFLNVHFFDKVINIVLSDVSEQTFINDLKAGFFFGKMIKLNFDSQVVQLILFGFHLSFDLVGNPSQ